MSKPQAIVVPDIDRFTRESTDFGPMGAILKRFTQLKLGQIFSIIFHQYPHLISLTQKDFAAAMILLIDLELVGIKKPKIVLLNAKVTDLALALGNRRLLSGFISQVKKNYQVDVGFETNNVNLLVQRLGSWNLTTDVIKVNSTQLTLEEKNQLKYLPKEVKLRLTG